MLFVFWGKETLRFSNSLITHTHTSKRRFSYVSTFGTVHNSLESTLSVAELMAHPHLKPCSLYLPAHKSSPPPLSWFSLQQRSFRSGNRGGKHVARSICKTVPYEGEPQLTLKFPVPIFHQTNQTAPKKTLEFLRLSQKKKQRDTL